MKKIIVLAAALPVAIMLTACGSGTPGATSTVTTTAAAEPAPTVTVTETATPEPAPTVTVTQAPADAIVPTGPVVEPGMYLVGPEVKPGLYRTVEEVTGYCLLSQDKDGDILDNEAGEAGHVIFRVKKATGSTFTVDTDCGAVRKIG